MNSSPSDWLYSLKCEGRLNNFWKWWKRACCHEWRKPASGGLGTIHTFSGTKVPLAMEAVPLGRIVESCSKGRYKRQRHLRAQIRTGLSTKPYAANTFSDTGCSVHPKHRHNHAATATLIRRSLLLLAGLLVVMRVDPWLR